MSKAKALPGIIAMALLLMIMLPIGSAEAAIDTPLAQIRLSTMSTSASALHTSVKHLAKTAARAKRNQTVRQHVLQTNKNVAALADNVHKLDGALLASGIVDRAILKSAINLSHQTISLGADTGKVDKAAFDNHQPAVSRAVTWFQRSVTNLSAQLYQRWKQSLVPNTTPIPAPEPTVTPTPAPPQMPMPTPTPIPTASALPMPVAPAVPGPQPTLLPAPTPASVPAPMPTATLVTTVPATTPASAPTPTSSVSPSGLSDTFNVMNYGAHADGVTDDSAAILATINAARGGNVYFPSGIYDISAPLTIPSGTSLVGAGLASVWLKGSIRFGSDCHFSNLRIGDYGACAVRNSGDVSNTIFTDCEFRGGGGATNSGNDNVVSLTSALSNVTFLGCNFECNLGKEDATQGLHFDDVFINPNTNAPTIQGVLFKDCHFGVSNGLTTGCPRMMVEIYVDPSPAVRTGTYSDINFEGCIFEAAADEDLDYSGTTFSSDNVTPSNGPCHITDCTFKGDGAAADDCQWASSIVAENGAGRLTITGNTFFRGRGDSFAASAQRDHVPAECSGYNTFSNNVIDSTNSIFDSGIAHADWEYVLLANDHNVVSNNTIINTSPLARCIGILGTASFNSVTDNTLINSPTGYFTVQLESHSSYNTVTGNELIGGGVNDEGGNNIVGQNP